MYNYRTLSKSQLIELVNSIESLLTPAGHTAKDASQTYSSEIQSQLAFEVGHLNGSIKSVIQLIGEYVECSK
jgi:ElaB/YqjD/DUF883 family membrane-anchored ribosome-binding protein